MFTICLNHSVFYKDSTSSPLPSPTQAFEAVRRCLKNSTKYQPNSNFAHIYIYIQKRNISVIYNKEHYFSPMFSPLGRKGEPKIPDQACTPSAPLSHSLPPAPQSTPPQPQAVHSSGKLCSGPLPFLLPLTLPCTQLPPSLLLERYPEDAPLISTSQQVLSQPPSKKNAYGHLCMGSLWLLNVSETFWSL